MADHLILLAPSANRVYASEANRLVAAELKIMLGADDHPAIEPVAVAWGWIPRRGDRGP